MKKVWWKVPLYCAVAGWVSFQLMVHILGKLAIVTLPDGTVTSNNTTWMLLSGCVFLVAILVGGFVFFRKMTRQDVFKSATVMVILNAIMGIIANIQAQAYPMIWVYVSEWSSFLSQFLFRLHVNEWVSALVVWSAPLLFVPFGKKS